MLGCVSPVGRIAELAHAVGAKLMLDACQSVPHMPVDVATLGCDFLVASGHKMCGPTGIGFLWAPYETLATMAPWQGGGGEMIDQVTLEGSTFAPPPGRFEAGTPAITQAIGLGAACDYLSAISAWIGWRRLSTIWAATCTRATRAGLGPRAAGARRSAPST